MSETGVDTMREEKKRKDEGGKRDLGFSRLG